MRTRMVASTVALLCLAMATSALAQQRAPLSGVIDPLKWGASGAEVLDKLKAELDDRYRDDLKTADTIKIDRLMREKAAEFERIKASEVRFDGQRTGYETSLMANEVVSGQGERLFRVDERRAQRYFVLKDDRLWKVVVTYNVSTIGEFPAFVAAVRKKYGPPKKISFSEETGERKVSAATWEDGTTRLVVADQSGFYSSYVMKYIEIGEGTQLEQARAGKGKGKAVGNARTDSMMADIFEDGGEGATEDLVDQITGVEVEVDLESGRPQTYVAPVLPDDTEAEPRERSKKRRARKAKPKKPAREAEPVIIY